MSAYLPAGVPLPAPESWEAPFWDFCNRKELRFQACAKCGAVRHPPTPTCPQCLSLDHDWIAASHDAELFTYTIIHHANHPALKAVVPYNAAVVAFPTLGHVRLVTNIVGDAPLRIGMPLRLVWESPAPGRWLPRFAPRTLGGAR